jgi:hypothetical protein
VISGPWIGLAGVVLGIIYIPPLNRFAGCSRGRIANDEAGMRAHGWGVWIGTVGLFIGYDPTWSTRWT